MEAAAKERRKMVDKGKEGNGKQKKENADGSKNSQVLEPGGEDGWMVDVGVPQQHGSGEGKLLMEEEEGEEQLGGETPQGGVVVGVGGEDEGDREE